MTHKDKQDRGHRFQKEGSGVPDLTGFQHRQATGIGRFYGLFHELPTVLTEVWVRAAFGLEDALLQIQGRLYIRPGPPFRLRRLPHAKGLPQDVDEQQAGRNGPGMIVGNHGGEKPCRSRDQAWPT